MCINERDLSTLSGYSEDEVYTFLVALSRQGILHYIPKKDIPRLHFLIRREDSQYLRIPYAAYQERRDKMSDRIGAVRTYIEEEETCPLSYASRLLGETESTPVEHVMFVSQAPRGYINISSMP